MSRYATSDQTMPSPGPYSHKHPSASSDSLLTRREGLARLLGWAIVGATATRVRAEGQQSAYEAPSVTDEVDLEPVPGSPIR